MVSQQRRLVRPKRHLVSMSVVVVVVVVVNFSVSCHRIFLRCKWLSLLLSLTFPQPLHSGIRVALSFNTLLAMNGDMREFRQPGVIQYTDTAARLS